VSESFSNRGLNNVNKDRNGASLNRQQVTEIKHIVANQVYKLVDRDSTSVSILEIEDAVIEDAVFIDPSLLTHQRNRGQDVIDPYQASRQARLGNQARWRVIKSDADGEPYPWLDTVPVVEQKDLA